MPGPDFDKTIVVLMAEFSRSGIAEISVRHGDFEIYLSNVEGQARGPRSAAPQPLAPAARVAAAPAARAPGTVPTAPAVTATADLPANARIVTAPNLGTFYRAPKPGASPYVEVGATIAEGDELCLIEVMKLFTAVRADMSGRLHTVLAEDGSMVEAGQPLFAVVPV